MTRYAPARRAGGLGPVVAAGGALLLLGALLALLGKLTLLALRGLLYAGLILVAVLVVAGREVAAHWPRRRHLYELLDPVGNCALDVYDELAPFTEADYDRARARFAQDPPTLVDDLLTPPTAKDPTMPRTLTPTEPTLERPVGSGRRLAALTRLLDVRPSLDLEDAAALIDAAASFISQGDSTAARRLLTFGAPGTAEELVEILAR